MKKESVFLVRNVGGENYGGGEAYQLKLAKKLQEYGFEPVIVTNSKELLRGAKDDGFKTLVPPYCKRQNWSGWRNVLLPTYWVFQKRLAKWYEAAMRKYGPTVINIQSRDDMIAGTIAARKLGVRVLWTDHADFKNWVLWNVNSKLKNAIGKRIIRLSRYAEKVIFVSRNIKAETEKMIAPKKINNAVVIENGVEDELNKYEKTQVTRGSFVFLGRVVEEKGVGELIEAFMMVIKKHPQARLNIYGDGKKKEFKDLCEGSKEIQFYDWPNEPLKVLAENEIFVLPSYSEGLSFSLLDAAMMRKEIIASSVDGNSEVVVDNETGLLVPAKNAKKLAEAMIRILDRKKEAETMAKNVRRKYEREFNFTKIFEEKMLPLYNKRREE